MRKKINVTFIKDLVEQEVIKNPNGLVSKSLAFKLENYLRKFINTKGATAKSIITNLIEIQVNNKEIINDIYGVYVSHKSHLC